MESPMMMDENTTIESPKKQINTNHPPNSITLALDNVNGARRSTVKR